MRLAKAVPLLVFGALLCAPSGSATSLTPKATFYVPLPIPISLPYQPWADTAAVAVNPDGNLVYVTDEKGSEVWEFSSDGVLLSKWTSGALKRPTGVATDPLGNVYVANNGNATVAKFTAGGKLVKRWSVPAAKSIAIGAGRVYVLTTLFNAVGEYSYSGANLTGFVASFPDQWWGFAGYDPPSIGIAKEIGTDNSGIPIVVGESDQPLSSSEPDCHSVIDIHHELDHHPYPDPLRSGEAVRFTPAGVPADHGFTNHSNKDCTNGWLSYGYKPVGSRSTPNGGRCLRAGHGRGPSRPSPAGPRRSRRQRRSAGHPRALLALLHLREAVRHGADRRRAARCRVRLPLEPLRALRQRLPRQVPQPAAAREPEVPQATAIRGARQCPLHVFGGLDATGGNKGVEVKLGCTLRVCAGTLDFEIARCKLCAAAPPLRFKLRPGTQRTFTLGLTKRARTLLGNHPGLKVQMRAVMKGLKKPVARDRAAARAFGSDLELRGPGAPGARPRSPARCRRQCAGAKLVVEYQSPDHSTIVRHRVLMTGAGRYLDNLALGSAGRWIIVVRWSGRRP